MSDDAINLSQKLSTFTERWSPKIVSQFNDCDVMVVKAEGEFNWHRHEDTDDFFLVLRGTLRIELRDRDVILQPGELFVVPRGVEHRPVAEQEVHLLLIEPKGVSNTGNAATAAKKVSI
ncbi:cupin domain-containing protein [Paracoccus aerodenitrificans]|uniref:cupin domain-containing protein n=1 Tax=Paracoccus aerodenitrificans TaxID=3017781 RepID=UPI0022EFEB1C|nr:cupin domain-containing protein [Paracoccus aerodenitrificans]WBU64934.1 cupin domain-containing protein [Paracoccus aerodenitrificans]